jgi:hypothetical protein
MSIEIDRYSKMQITRQTLLALCYQNLHRTVKYSTLSPVAHLHSTLPARDSNHFKTRNNARLRFQNRAD